MTRIFQTMFTLSAMLFVATGTYLSYAPDPINGHFSPHGDGLMMVWVGFSLCLLPAMLELESRFNR